MLTVSNNLTTVIIVAEAFVVSKYRPAIQRGIILLAIWACALSVCAKATVIITEHNKLNAEVAQLEENYDARVQEYAGLLAEGEKISSDHDKQVSILKENYGYTLPDETPIVIVIEQSDEN